MPRVFDFLERSRIFSQDVFRFLERVPKRGQNTRLCDQLYRCVPSIGANYNEATDSLGRRDRLMKLRTSRREANESRFFLDLLLCTEDMIAERSQLSQEARELANILSSMIAKAEAKETK